MTAGQEAASLPAIYALSTGLAGDVLLMPCPSPGEALERAMRALVRRDAGMVLSLLPDDEAEFLGVANEAEVAAQCGLDFRSFPIEDRSAPKVPGEIVPLLEELLARLRAGEHVAVHCRAGIGRTGLVASGLLVWLGRTADEACAIVSAVRGEAVPEVEVQGAFVTALAGLRKPTPA